MQKSIAIAMILLLSFPASLSAHSDTIFYLAADGAIERLHEKYQPASFSRESYKLSIGKNYVFFPSCLKNKLFPSGSEHKISLSGSWYHDPRIMPPYINFKISVPDRTYVFKLLLELETLKIIEVSLEDSFKNGDSQRNVNYTIDLKEYCLNTYHRSIRQYQAQMK